MEEELLKRNMDCVYFLASPFTCKKGMDCEYRHNEMARLNLRDCWYWKLGNCLNPTCGFRHPPLEINSESLVGAAPFAHFSSLPSIKHNVPCYFYFSGYCNKGDRCAFLHAPNDSSSVKARLDQEDLDAPASDAKATAKTVSSLPSPVKVVSSLEEVLKVGDQSKVEHTEHVERFPVNIIFEPNSLKRITAHEYEDVVPTKLDSLYPSVNVAKVEPSSCSDESFEDLVDDYCMEREELLESSPGFDDVLVDGIGRSETMGYEDEEQCLKGLDMNDDESLEYQYAEEYGYDQMDYDRRILLEDIRHESSVYSDDEQRFDLAEFSSLNSMGQDVNARKFLTMELPVGGHYEVDLRHHLRKRRIGDHHLEEMHASRRHNNMSRLTTCGSSQQRVQGKLASKVERNGVALSVGRNTVIISANKRGWSTNSRHDRPPKRSYDMRKKPSAGKVPRKPSSKRKNYVEHSSFTGPRTLAQIKEGMSKGGNSFVKIAGDFEGPKPLSEILKKKRRVTSIGTV
ncbi:hypothetical protein Dimus_023526 [Dionaea muscipula]